MGKEQDLLEAARKGDVGLVGKLLHAIGKRSGPLSSFRKSPGINIQDVNGYTPLHHACLNNHVDIVRLLLSHGAFPDVPDIRGSTPLYLGSWAGNNEIVKMLLMTSAVNPNAQTSDNETPLHCAAQHGHNTVLATLLAHGADPSIRNNSFQTPLDLAAQFGRLQVVKILLSTHPELIEQFKILNSSATSTLTPTTLITRSLPNTTLNFNNNTNNNNYYSESNGFVTPERNIFTHTCLHLASRNGHKKVVEVLLNSGIDVNLSTYSGTALHEAALCGKKSVVSILLKAGVDPFALDGKGRTVLDVLKDYPPHVTYEITSLIKDFCNLSQSDRHFRPIVLSESKAKDKKIKTAEKFYSLPRQTKLEVNRHQVENFKETNNKLSPTFENSLDKQSLLVSNSLISLRNPNSSPNPEPIQRTAIRASYVPMKPIIKESSSASSSNEKLTSYQPVYQTKYSVMSNSNTVPRKTKAFYPEPTKHNCSPYEMMCLTTTRESRRNSSNRATPEPSRYHCVDEYVDMSGPHSTPTPTPTPTPSSNKFEFANYENVNLSDDMKFKTKEQEIPAIKRILSTDANNNKEHSPTPDFPPPSVSTAEKTIFEFMCPQNDKEKRRSLRLNNEDLKELETYFLEKTNLSDNEETLSEHVQEYLSDTPFAGLFKGSTLNLANGDDEVFIHENREALRSPSLVKSVVPATRRRNVSNERNSLKAMQDKSASMVWKEIDDILEQIDKEVQDNVESLNGMESEEFSLNDQEDIKSKTSTLSIRKPKELLFSNSNNVATNWCHSPEALLFNQVEYDVYYLGSTIIRNLQGTYSTRLSIQKLKIDESELEKEADADLLKDCTKSTKYLKANNLQTRLAVGIAISYLGVKFRDKENQTMICLHSIENINCVCQDAEDLRYFAYITRENDVHYCHVFMVDNLDLAKEIILTLGQAFEVAYQVAISNESSETLVAPEHN